MVKGLWSLIKPRDEKGEKISSCGSLVSLTSLAGEHFKKTGKDLLLVSDMSILSWLYRDPNSGLDWSLNGDYQALRAVLRKFFQQMKDSHISFAFFLNAMFTKKNNEPAKNKRFHESLIKMMKGKKNLLEEKCDIIIAQRFAVTELAFAARDASFPVHMVSDKGILYSFARTENAYGVLVNETDALAYGTIFLSADSMEFDGKELRCFQFVPQDVCKFIGCDQKLLPYLAVLASTDGADNEDVNKFKTSLRTTAALDDSHNLLQQLIKYMAPHNVHEDPVKGLVEMELSTEAAGVVVKLASHFTTIESIESDHEDVVKTIENADKGLVTELFSSFYSLHNVYDVLCNRKVLLNVNREYFGRDFLSDIAYIVNGSSDAVNIVTLPLRKTIYAVLCGATSVVESGPIGERFESKMAVQTQELELPAVHTHTDRVQQLLLLVGCADVDNDFFDDTTELLQLLPLMLLARQHQQPQQQQQQQQQHHQSLFEWEFDALIAMLFDINTNKTNVPKVDEVSPRAMYVLSVYEQMLSMVITLATVLKVVTSSSGSGATAANQLPPPSALLAANSFFIRYNAAKAAAMAAASTTTTSSTSSAPALPSMVNKIKSSLIAGASPNFLTMTERKPPFTAYVRNIDAEEEEDTFRHLFEHLEPTKPAELRPPRANPANPAAAEEEKREFAYTFIEFPTLEGLRGACLLNGKRFGRFVLEVSPAEKKKTTTIPRQDRDGFEKVKTTKQKTIAKRAPQNASQPQKKKTDLNQVRAATNRKKHEEDEMAKRRRVKTANAFSALLEDEDDE